jgi:uncharacterized protein YjdB
MRARLFAVAFAAVAATIGATACGGDGPSDPPDQSVLADSVATVTIAPANPTVSLGATLGLTVTLRDSSGSVVVGPVVDWSSGRPDVARVANNGVVTGVGVGSAVIRASVAAPSGERAGTATVLVVELAVASVTVSPSVLTIPVGRVEQLSATVEDTEGNVVTGRPILWASTSSAVIVDDFGRITAMAAGNATITATCGGVVGSASITVTAPPSP